MYFGNSNVTKNDKNWNFTTQDFTILCVSEKFFMDQHLKNWCWK